MVGSGIDALKDNISFPQPIHRDFYDNKSERTAILISGELRTGNISFMARAHNYDYKNQREFFDYWVHELGGELFVNDTRTPIDTVLQGLIDPVAKHGGVDVFIYIPVYSKTKVDPQWNGNSLTYQSYPGDLRPCELYSNHPVFGPYTGNKVFCLIEFEKRLSDAFISRPDSYRFWAQYAFQLSGREVFLQQEYGKYRANLACKEYSLSSGIQYKYKIRLRPDMAVVRPIQNFANITASFRSTRPSCSSIVYFASKPTGGQGIEDSFNLGLARDMDIVLDRYQEMITGSCESCAKHRLNTWNSELDLNYTLWNSHICLESNDDIIVTKTRHRFYRRPLDKVVEDNAYDWVQMNQ